jgi:hypothetical protein
MKLIPRARIRSDFRISKPTLISSTGSAASETRRVSPIPSEQQAQTDRGFHRAAAQATRFGDPEVQRLIDLFASRR